MSFGMAYATKKRAGKGAKMCADGGEVGTGDNEGANMQDADMIARIVHKRREYSKGGEVANETPALADSLPNEFDDLVLDDNLDAEIPEDDDEVGDPVSKIMSKRKKG